MKKWLSFLLFLPTVCFATVNQLEFNFGRGIPQSFIQANGSSDRAGSMGTEWSADFLHQVSPGAYFGVGGGQFRSNDDETSTFVPNADTTLRSRTTSILFLTRADLPSQTRMTPYFIVGLGWARNSLNVMGLPGGPALLDETKNALAYAYGLGIDYAVSSRVFIGIDARYQGSFKQTYGYTPEGRTVTGVNNVQTSLNAFMYGVKAGIKY